MGRGSVGSDQNQADHSGERVQAMLRWILRAAEGGGGDGVGDAGGLGAGGFDWAVGEEGMEEGDGVGEHGLFERVERLRF